MAIWKRLPQHPKQQILIENQQNKECVKISIKLVLGVNFLRQFYHGNPTFYYCGHKKKWRFSSRNFYYFGWFVDSQISYECDELMIQIGRNLLQFPKSAFVAVVTFPDECDCSVKLMLFLDSLERGFTLLAEMQ